MSKPKNPEKVRIRSHFVEIASHMPALSHWPDRSKPFDYQDSDVCHWLLSQPGVKQWLFDKARNMGAIVFQPETETWVGKSSIPPS
jgi:hypothetical protein